MTCGFENRIKSTIINVWVWISVIKKSNFTEDFFNKCIIVVRHSTSNWGVDTRKKRMRLVRAIALTIPVDMYYGCTSFSWSDHPQNAAALLIWGLTTWTKVIRHLHFKKHPPQRNWHCGDINSTLRRRSIADSKKIISFQNFRPLDGSRHLTVRAFKLGR